MLASMRAELLLLRKWPAAWGLILVPPTLVLLYGYVAHFVSYLALTPADYTAYGTPAQNLPELLPSQFNIIAVFQFTFSGTTPFIVLGAVLAGGDWGRGTITTALLQRPGRARSFAGQAFALAAAITVSVLATFAVAAAASVVIGRVEAKSVTPYLTALPGTAVIAKSAGAALLVALTYGMLGLFLGTVCRSGAGAIAVGMLWTLVIENNLYNLALQLPHGILRTVSDLTPGVSAITVTGLFGDPGGGADSQSYLPVSPLAGVVTLAVYMTAAVAVTMVIVRRRDAVAGKGRALRRRMSARSAGPPRPAQHEDARTAMPGVRACLRAELLVMSKRPAVWALVLALPGEMLINSYFSSYVLYATASTGIGSLGISAPQVLATMMPAHYLVAALSGGFGPVSEYNYVYLAAVFMLLGALIGGSDWSRHTIRTALLQRPGRLQTFTGQALAVTIAVATSVVVTFILAAAGSAIVALHQTGSLAPAGSQFPGLGHVAETLAAALLLGLAYTAAGLALGIWLRSATAAASAALLLAVIIQPSAEFFAAQLHGAALHLYELLPDAATNTVINLDGNPNLALYGYNAPSVQTAPAIAFLTLALYAAAFLAIPALITKRRDLT